MLICNTSAMTAEKVISDSSLEVMVSSGLCGLVQSALNVLCVSSVAKEKEPILLRPKRAASPRRSPRARTPPRVRKEPDYSVRLSTRPIVTLERDYQDIIHRYSCLYVSAEFAKSVSTWVHVSSSMSWLMFLKAPPPACV